MSIPLSLHATRCFNFPNAVASMSTIDGEKAEATFDPKETTIKPWPPELLTNSSKIRGEWFNIFDTQWPNHNIAC